MEVLHTFGIQPVLLIAQIVNFLIVLYLLKRFLYKPVFKMLHDRKILVQQGVEKTEEAQKLLEKTQKEEKDILKKAQQEARLLIDDAKKQADSMAKEAEIRAKKETGKMIEEAKGQIQRDVKDAEGRLTKHISTLAAQFLRKSLEDLVDQHDQEVLMQRALKKMEEAN